MTVAESGLSYDLAYVRRHPVDWLILVSLQGKNIQKICEPIYEVATCSFPPYPLLCAVFCGASGCSCDVTNVLYGASRLAWGDLACCLQKLGNLKTCT